MHRHDGRLGALVDFLRRRGRRILPAFWFSLAILIPLRTPERSFSADGWKKIALFFSTNQFLAPGAPTR